MRTIRRLRSDPATPATQASGDSMQNLQTFRDALGVDLRLVPGLQHDLVAGLLALLQKARPDPPHRRVEPEDRFHHHVHRGCEIVAPANVADLVGDDGAELRGAEALFNPMRQQQHGAKDAKDAGFDQVWRRQNRNLGQQRHARRGTDRGSNPQPPAYPREDNNKKAAKPNRHQISRAGDWRVTRPRLAAQAPRLYKVNCAERCSLRKGKSHLTQYGCKSRSLNRSAKRRAKRFTGGDQ